MKKKTEKGTTKEALFDPETGKFRRNKLLVVGKTLEEVDHNMVNAIVAGIETAISAVLNAPDRQQILNEWFTVHEDRVLDEDFFKIIQEEPSMLGSTFAQEKIKRWRNELNNTKKAGIARMKLEKIGKSLIPATYRGKDKPEETRIAYVKYQVSEMLRTQPYPFNFSSHEKVEEAFGTEVASDNELSTLIGDWKALSPKKIPPLAERIVAKQSGLSLETVKTYIKRVRQIMDRKGNPQFTLKKPKP